MTTLEPNMKLFRQLSIIAEDEALIHEAAKAVRRFVQQRETQTEYISKEEVFAGVRQGLIDVKESRKNGTCQRTLQEVVDELQDRTTEALSERVEAVGKEVSFTRAEPPSVTG